MKAIIIAAGMGNRLDPLTDHLPKCMLKFGDKTLLQHQVETLRRCGINDIVVVKGFEKEKINYPDLRYYINVNYENNNILNSLFYAEEEMEGDLVVSYSDILFEKRVAERLLKSKMDITIVVDIDWQAYYEGRTQHPVAEAEKVTLGPDNEVLEIGKIVAAEHDVHGEFIGMMKLTPRGTETLKRNFNRAKQLFWGNPFQRAATFEKAYLTDMIQDLIDVGVKVHASIIKRGWREIDTVQDYEKALREMGE